MFDLERSYSTALSKRGDAGVREAIACVITKQKESGRQILLYLPGKQDLSSNPVIEQFTLCPKN